MNEGELRRPDGGCEADGPEADVGSFPPPAVVFRLHSVDAGSEARLDSSLAFLQV